MRVATGVKFCTMVSTRLNFIMPFQNFGRHTPRKISGAKNVQNLARFRTILKFCGEYLRNGWRYSKSDSHFIYHDSSGVRRNKSGEVWSSNLGDLDVESYPPKTHFSEAHISAPKFLHALENDQVLLAHPTSRTGAPLTTFFKRKSKIVLKCSVLDERTLERKRVALWDFATWRAAGWVW